MIMAEYIKRDKAIAALNKVRDDQRVFKYATASDFLSARDAIERAIKVLESLPAADVAQVRHGRWIASHDEFCACSICKYPVYVGWNQTNYCPNCGAKMDEGDEND